MYNRLFFNVSNEKYIFYQLYKILILYFSMHFIKQYEQRNRMRYNMYYLLLKLVI